MNAVLWIPPPGALHPLLKPGAHGAMPPLAYRGRETGMWFPKGPYTSPAALPEALILAWDGDAVVEGCDRLVRALIEHNPRSSPDFHVRYSLFNARALAIAATVAFGGTWVETPKGSEAST